MKIMRLTKLLVQERVKACLHVLLQIAVKELIVIEMIDTVVKQPFAGIDFGVDIGQFERAARFVNVRAAQRGRFFGDRAAIVGQAGTEVQAFVCVLGIG